MMAPIFFINVAFGIVFAEGFLRGKRTYFGHTSGMDMDTEVEAKSSLASFLAEMSSTIDALIRGDGGADTHGGMAGIIRHGMHKIDPSDAASKLLSDTKAFPQGPPEELRKVLHHLAKKHRRARKQPSLKIKQNDLTGMTLKSKEDPTQTSEYISDNADEITEPLETTDADIHKAVTKCNDMVVEANDQLETVMFNCWEQGNATRKQQFTVEADLNRFIEETTQLRAKAIKTKGAKEEAEEELASIETANTTETVQYQGKMKQMKEQMGKLKTELAVTKFMLNITKCPAAHYADLDLLQKSLKGSSHIVDNKIEFCQSSGNGSTKLAFLNQRLESASQQLSVQARERLALSLSGVGYGPGGEKLDDGDDDDAEVDQSGKEDVDNLDMGQGIALIQKSGTSQSQSLPDFQMKCTGVCTAADRCSRLEADCAHLYDVFAGIWGEVKDQVERLQEEMEQTTLEYEKLKSFNNRESEILSHQISSLDAIFIETESEKISLIQQTQILQAEQKALSMSYQELCDKCLEECSYIAGTLICGPLAVRNELVQHLDGDSAIDPTEIRDCVMTDFRAEQCSVECDDNLVGGFQILQREVMEPEDELYGTKCPSTSRTMKCNQFKCPVNCEIDEWSDWSECTRECGGGAQTRQRNIKVHPKNGGAGCAPLTDTQPCNIETCDKDCGLLAWTDWSPCSSACGGGMQARFRDEDAAKPAEGINGQCPDYYDPKRYLNGTCNEDACVGDEVCIASMDVVILIDSSGSLSQKGFDILKNLASKILDRLKSTSYGNEAVRVGVVQFGNGHLNGTIVSPAKLVQTFSSNFNTTKASIAGMKYQKGFTNMAQGLMRAKDLLAKKARDGAAGTVLMITDGFPSFEYETEQAAQRLRKSANLVIAHVKNNPRPYDMKLMMKYARYIGNYVSIPGKQKLKEDMLSYASKTVVKMCPEAESVSVIAEKDGERMFQKKLQGFWCADPMPDQWFEGKEGHGWSDEMSLETCFAKAKEVSSEWKFFEYTTYPYPNHELHECLVYTKECNTNGWQRWTHANIYEAYVKPAEISQESLFSSVGPNAE
jgi:uncharacterized protein YegL